MVITANTVKYSTKEGVSTSNIVGITPNSNVKEWSTWPMTPHTEDEIREKCLTEYNNVCFSYVCSMQMLSEHFVEELVVLSTGWFDKSNYTKEAMDDAIDAFRQYFDKKNRGIKLKNPDWKMKAINYVGPGMIIKTYREVGYNDIIERLDWPILAARFKFSPEFEKRYGLDKLKYVNRPSISIFKPQQAAK